MSDTATSLAIAAIKAQTLWDAGEQLRRQAAELHPEFARMLDGRRTCGVVSSGLEPMACGVFVDEDGKHQGWHAGFNPETGQTMTWTARHPSRSKRPGRVP